MDILIACEESQEVMKAFRDKGHNAYSCDMQECSGGQPQYHIKDSVLNHLNDGWDMMIGFPPCTFLTVTANKWFTDEHLLIEPERKQLRESAIQFFIDLYNAPIDKICLENPVGVISTAFKKPSQIIHPYYFGDPFEKRTCLWLKNLKPLVHINQPDLFNEKATHVAPPERYTWIDKKTGKIKSQPEWYALTSKKGGERGKIRSKTFPAVANAMAEQWG